MKNNNQTQDSTIGDTGFEKMLDIVFKDMVSRHTDIEVKKIKDVYSTNSLATSGSFVFAPTIEASKRLLTYPQIQDNFVSGGKWDHKVQGRENLDSFYRTDEKNKDGKSSIIFGGKIPTDDKNVYDHDLWGNISYGYTLRTAGLPEMEIRGAAVADDLRQSAKSKKFDLKDDDMVAFGVMLYEKYGDKMTKEDLRREIIANKDKFRKYPLETLDKRSARAKSGDDLAKISKREGVSVSDIQKQLDKDVKQNDKVYGNINDQMSLIEGRKVNLPHENDREQNAPLLNVADIPTKNAADVPVKNVDMGATIQSLKPEKDEKRDAEVSKIIDTFKVNDNKLEDVLLKPSKDITYGEMMQAKKAAMFDIKDKELQQKFNQKITNFFETFYGKEDVKYDEVGKMVRPEALMPFPEQSKEVMTKDNVPMGAALQQLASSVVDSGSKALQRGLNIFGDFPALKEDGVIGVKTTSRAKEMMVKNGVNAVQSNINVGAFEKMVEDNRKKEIPQDTLKSTVSKIGSFAEKTLQQGLNALGQTKKGFQELEEDNDVGPKTTVVFNQMKNEDEEGIKKPFRSKSFAHMIGRNKLIKV